MACYFAHPLHSAMGNLAKTNISSRKSVKAGYRFLSCDNSPVCVTVAVTMSDKGSCCISKFWLGKNTQQNLPANCKNRGLNVLRFTFLLWLLIDKTSASM